MAGGGRGGGTTNKQTQPTGPARQCEPCARGDAVPLPRPHSRAHRRRRTPVRKEWQQQQQQQQQQPTPSLSLPFPSAAANVRDHGRWSGLLPCPGRKMEKRNNKVGVHKEVSRFGGRSSGLIRRRERHDTLPARVVPSQHNTTQTGREEKTESSVGVGVRESTNRGSSPRPAIWRDASGTVTGARVLRSGRLGLWALLLLFRGLHPQQQQQQQQQQKRCSAPAPTLPRANLTPSPPQPP